MGMNNQASIARKRWRGIIQRQVERGVSVSVFCREENVPQVSFYHWRRKLREENGFAEVLVAPGSASINSVAPGSTSTNSVSPGRPSSSAKSSMDRLAPSAQSPITCPLNEPHLPPAGRAGDTGGHEQTSECSENSVARDYSAPG